MIDTHCHIFADDFADDVDEVIQRALDKQVKKMILPNIDINSMKSLIELSNKYPNIYPAIGIHPTNVGSNPEEELDMLYNQYAENQFFAIGETGLDLYWLPETIDLQLRSLNAHIKLSLKLNLPLIIHSRNSKTADDETLQDGGDCYIKTIETLSQTPGTRGVFHCFSGSKAQAEQIIKMGFYIGIGGSITYKKNFLHDYITEIPLSSIVLETDSPYLAPMPFRGKRNEPSYIIYIAEKLAQLYSVSVEEIIKQTTINSEILFGI